MPENQIELTSTIVDNDSREALVAKYLADDFETKFIASQDEGITCSYMSSNRSLVEVFIREYQSKYAGKLKLHKLIKYPSYSENWEALFKAIQVIQDRRLNVQIKYLPDKLVHAARIYDCVGVDKNPLIALFNALLQWIFKNTQTMGMFQEINSEGIQIITDGKKY